MTSSATLNQEDFTPVHIDIYQGSRFVLNFSVIDDSTGLPIDITNYDFQGSIKYQPGDATSLLDFNVSNGRIVKIDNAGGLYDWVLEAEDTVGLAFNQARYDLFMIDPSQQKRLIMHGVVNLKKRITVTS